MKRYFSLLIAFAAVLAVNAQIYSYESTAIEHHIEKSKSETTWYVRAGLSSMSVEDCESCGSTDSKLGYEVSVGFQKPFTNLGFYWGMEAGLGSQGYEAEEGNEYYGSKEEDFGHAIRFSPITVGYKYDISAWDIAIDAHFGAFASYTFGGEMEWEEWYSNGNDYYGYETYSYSDSDSYWGDTDGEGFDIGMKIGLGVWYKKFNLDFSFQRGFMEQYHDGDAYNKAFCVSLGYAF